MPPPPRPETERRHALPTSIVFLLLALLSLAASPGASAADEFPPYTNHTVGGAAGWVFDSTSGKPAVNYTAWAESQSFYVGDFMLFNTNPNSTVIQTTNATTYNLCSLDQDFGNLTSQLGADLADMSGSSGGPIPAQLTQAGDDYFFSHLAGGAQCRAGMRFRIKVKQGRGLPPPPPPPGLLPKAAAAPPLRQEGGDERAGTGDAVVGSGADAVVCRRKSSVVGVVLLGVCSIALLAMA